MLGEDVQDQPGAVDDLDLEHLFQLAQLAWAQFTIADYGVRTERCDKCAQFQSLPRSEVGGGIR